MRYVAGLETLKRGLVAILVLLPLFIDSCKRLTHSNRVVIVQPLGDIPMAQVMPVVAGLKNIHDKVLLRPAISLPATAFYRQRNRYRADSLIRFLNRFGNADTVVIGLTSKDISTTAHGQADWGIMGLAFQPGAACVVSTFRLSQLQRSTQFFKVAIHELGHTQELPHCKNPTCYMRDAAGGNPLDEETGFCASCKSFLISKGWKL